MRPYLTNSYRRLGYHAINIVFVYLPIVYAWAATAETLLHRPYFVGYWRRVNHTYEPSFRRFVDRRLSEATRSQASAT